MSEERITCRTPTPGRQPTTIPAWKYHAVRSAILEVVPGSEPGVAARDLPRLVRARLTRETLQALGSVSWHTTTVKLEMEMSGELRRLAGITPQHLVRT